MLKTLIKKILQSLNDLWQKYFGERFLPFQYKRSADDFQWRRAGPCPKKRVEGNAVMLGDKLYLFGGYETIDRVLNRCDVFDFRKNRWVDQFPMPAHMAQTHFGCATDDKRFIYFSGGQIGAQCGPCTHTCFVLDTQTTQFSEFPSLPNPRYVATMQLWKGRLHVVGGSMPDRFTPDNEHWSIAVHEDKPTETTWRKEVPIPRGGIHRGSVIIDDVLYIFGGSEGDIKPVPSDPTFQCNWKSPFENLHGEVYKLEAGAKSWQQLADMPNKLAHTDMAVVGRGKEILVFGGTEEKRTQCSNVVLRYDIATDRWEQIGTLPYPFKSTGAFYFQGQYFLFTGQRSYGARDLRPYPDVLNNVWIAPDPRKKASRTKRLGILPMGGKDWIAGINYLQNIVKAVRLLPAEEQPQLFFICKYQDNISELAHHFGRRREDFHCYAYLSSDNWRTKGKAILGCLLKGIRPRSLKDLVKDLRIDAFAPMLDVLSPEISVPWIGWIPDFQHKALPDFFSVDELKKRDKYFRELVDQAHHVIVSSEDAYQGLMKWFPTDKKKVSIFQYPFLTEQAWYAGDPAAILRKYHLPEKYLMFPGQFWVHKNHQMLFDAIGILVKERGHKDIVLVCSGRQHDFRFPDYFSKVKAFINANGLADNIRLLGLIDREDQIQLIRACAAIVQPSLFEGWCLMIEEARSFGKRIFLSDLAVHREQDPPRASYFDPYDARGLAELLEKNWPGLKAGVDLEAEAKARLHSKSADLDLAKRFNAIITKTLNKEVISCT